MSKFKCYLAGKMGGLTFEQMNTWRASATNLLKDESDNRIRTINPCDFYNFNQRLDTYTEKEIKCFDLYQVEQSDLILVNLNFSASIGTAMEICMAHDVWRKPVIGFGDQSHPWMELCITKRCVTLEESVDYILDYFLPNY